MNKDLNETPLISIITTAYNIEKYLPLCLDSIQAQTYDNFELLLIDDGSTDRTGIICDEYAKKDSRIHVIHQKNVGVSDSWNEAIKHVKGKYTGFVDGDDLVHPLMFELLYRAIQETQSSIAYCDYEKLYGENGGFLSEEKNNNVSICYIRDCTIDEAMASNLEFASVWRGLYKTDMIRDVRFLSGINGQDFLWSTRILLQTNHIAKVDKILYKWRKRTGSESYNAFRFRMLDYLIVRRYALTYLKEKKSKWVVPYASAMLTVCIDSANRILTLPESDHERYRSEIKKAMKEFSAIGVIDIIRDPYSKKRRKLLAIIGKISFPFARFLKKIVVKVIN